MDIVLFRHGLAVEREEWEGKEHDRPLTDKGKKRARLSAEGLTAAGVAVTHILSSPLTRARETADILRNTLKVRPTIRLCDELLPDAPVDKLFALLGTYPSAATVLCVGHEPHLSAVAGLLLAGKPIPGLVVKKAGACLIHCEEMPQIGKGILEWWFPPSLLRAIE
ncbi:MAG: phosphohistidine phosphatase SixA [Nitrospiraceae bacterium]|mgnify:CR=1 FL=1|nr:phosphohistidine phosphatase SixA [Nitrospiraceae bacterium]